MLIVDSPFPPYVPVEVDVYAVPDTSGMGFNEVFRAMDAPYGVWDWEGNVPHKDGDLPAEVTGDHFFGFIKAGVRHRIHGVAMMDSYTASGAKSYFYLYGHNFTVEAFERIHKYAIQNGVPLWVAVLAEVFKDRLDDWDDFAAEIAEPSFLASETFSKALSRLNVTWLLKVWGVEASWWDETMKDDYPDLKTMVENMERVIAYETVAYNYVRLKKEPWEH